MHEANKFGWAAVLSVFCACGHAPPATTSSPAATTRYERGDYIVYRYSGTFTSTPVVLREQIVEQIGNRLSIEVTAERGTERRKWLQVVTDSPENEQSNTIDELYEVGEGGVRTRLANENNADLARLYGWTLLMPDGKASDVVRSQRRIQILKEEFPCKVTRGRNTWNGKPVRFEESECSAFLWTHGPSRFWDERTQEDVLRVEVVDWGRKRPPTGVLATH